MKFIFRGAAREVGRSCIELQTEGDRFLLDCGVKFEENGFSYPKGLLNIRELDGVFLSHAHLDHSGGLPFFEHKDLQGPIFCTSQTKTLTRILLKDSFEIARIKHLHPAFDRTDLREVKKDITMVKFDTAYKHRNIRYSFHNAGHIPGSASILLEVEGKRVLYSGDINLTESMLMHATTPDYENIDILIVESTYGYRDLPDRMTTGKRFLKRIKEVIKRGGSVLIPVFAIGRAQEILQILSFEEWDVPIYFDGMSKKVTRNILVHPSKYIKNKERLAEMFYDVVQMPKSREERERVASKQGIFVTTSGMLQGGPVMSYLKRMWHDEKNAIFLSGYQCKRTNGRHLLDDGYVYIDGWKTDVKCEVEKFDFSGHADRRALKKYIKAINPKAVIFQHGDNEAVEEMGLWAKKNLKAEVFIPSLLDEIEF